MQAGSTAPTLKDYRHLERRCDGAGPADAPLVSVVTICRDAARTIARTIDSVQAQAFPSLEHVIVDGGSTDGTTEIVRARLRPQDHLLREPDRGISDALNKGVALARGRYIQFAHADDWLSPDQIKLAVAALEPSEADFVFGDLIFYENGAPSFRYRGDPDYARSLHRRMPALNHPTVLARRRSFERIGLFSLSYRCAMEYDWFLRLHRAGGRGMHVTGLCGHMNHDGVSNLRWWRTMAEVAAIAQAHGRNRQLAQLERAFRLAKVASGRAVKSCAQPVYRLVRNAINPAFSAIAPSSAPRP